MAAISIDQSKQIYDSLKGKNSDFKSQITADFLRQRGLSNVKNVSDLTNTLSILQKCANQYDLNTFHAGITTGEMPALKLSKEELECLNGGTWRDCVDGFIAGGTIVVCCLLLA